MILTKAKKEELRNRCRTDLFFLAKTIFGKGLTERTHRPVTDFFVKKTNVGLPENYTQEELQSYLIQLDSHHVRMLMYPRGFYKSTLDGIDCVQWVINFPDIRILILTGEYSLAEQFMFEIRKYFTIVPKATLSLFQQLFPEFCIPAGEGSNLEFRCPAAHLGLPAPTIWINSIESTLSGWHCDIIKADDVVTDRNSITASNREKVIARFDGARELLDPHGFLDLIGTRYAVDDLYGVMLQRNVGLDDHDLKYYCDSAWKRLPHVSKDKPILELTKDDVELRFPEKFTFKVLRDKLIANEMLFRCQQLNEPVFSIDTIFDICSLRTATISPNSFPADGEVYIAWDWAHTTNEKSNYSVGVVAKKDEQDRLFILDMVRGKFRPDELAYQVVKLIQMYSPRRTMIEETNGAGFFKLEITRLAAAMHVALNLDWIPVDVHAQAKLDRVRGLQPLINTGRFFFSSTLSQMDKIYDEFTKFTGTKGREDDIPDACSFLLRLLPKYFSYRELKEAEITAQQSARDKQLYKELFPEPKPPEISQVLDIDNWLESDERVF